MAAKGPVDTVSRGALGDAGLLLQESLSFPSTNACGQMGTRSSVAVPLEQVANLEQGCPLKCASVQGKRAGELINKGKTQEYSLQPPEECLPEASEPQTTGKSFRPGKKGQVEGQSPKMNELHLQFLLYRITVTEAGRAYPCCGARGWGSRSSPSLLLALTIALCF